MKAAYKEESNQSYTMNRINYNDNPSRDEIHRPISAVTKRPEHLKFATKISRAK